MTRRRLTNKQRLELFEAHKGRCHLCGHKITVGDKWSIDHRIPLALGGPDEGANLAPVHDRCHAVKTTSLDVPAIAKSERVRQKHSGAWKARWPMAGSRASGWKKKMDGTTVRRG